MEPVNYLALSTNTSTDFVRSALPGAPVVPFELRTRRAPRTRSAIAGGLYRLGDAIAPSKSQPEAVTA